MSAGAIGGFAATASSGAATESGAFGALQSEDFINVLLSELSNQDPFEPADSAALLEQLSSLRNIESQLSLQTSIESLVKQNRLASSASLIGKAVEGLDATGQRSTGIVESVRVEDGEAVLRLKSGRSVPMSNLTQILDEGGEFATIDEGRWNIVGKNGAAAKDDEVTTEDMVAWNALLARNMNRTYEAGDFNEGEIPPDKVGQKFEPRGFTDGDLNGDGRIDELDFFELGLVTADVRERDLAKAEAERLFGG